MSASRHAGQLHQHVPGDSVVHHMAPQAKLAGLAAFVAVVAVIPRQRLPVFATAAVVVALVVALARLSPRTVAVRLAAVVPFVAFALFVPFLGTGERTEVLWFSVSVDGLWAMWNVLAKALLGATAAIVVAATTPIPDVVLGLTRLRIPRVLVGIVAFAFRYLDLVADQLWRMSRAMIARGHDPRWLWQARPIASSVGVLFVRTYERGERVHQAMVSRGYRGTMPELEPAGAPGPPSWIAAVPSVVVLVALTTSVVTK